MLDDVTIWETYLQHGTTGQETICGRGYSEVHAISGTTVLTDELTFTLTAVAQLDTPGGERKTIQIYELKELCFLFQVMKV